MTDHLLPVEIWKLIFEKHLSEVNDLLRLRLVCKSFQSIVRVVKITSLAVRLGRKNDKMPLTWETSQFFGTNQLIKNSNVLFTCNARFFSQGIMRWMLYGLEALYIENGMGGSKDSVFSLYALKNLGQLEQLQIDTLNPERNTSLLRSSSLQRLCIGDFKKKTTLTLRCRKLREFKTRTNLSRFYFPYPEKITLLHVEDLKDDHSELNQFKNLQHLIVRNGNHNGGDILQLLPEDLVSLKMKEIDKQKMQYLLKQKKLLRRLNLKIYLSGILIETNQEIDDFYAQNDTMFAERTKLILSKYGKLSDICPWIHEINYSVVWQHFGGRTPDDFFSKLVNIETIVVDQLITDADHFGEFIGRCCNLRKLHIEATVDQRIYDCLHNACDQLTSLTINDSEAIDLEFVLNQKNLVYFTTNQEIQPNKLAEFGNLKHLQVLEFSYNGKEAEIRSQTYGCQFTIDNNMAFFDYKDEVFEFLKLFVDN